MIKFCDSLNRTKNIIVLKQLKTLKVINVNVISCLLLSHLTGPICYTQLQKINGFVIIWLKLLGCLGHKVITLSIELKHFTEGAT